MQYEHKVYGTKKTRTELSVAVSGIKVVRKEDAKRSWITHHVNFLLISYVMCSDQSDWLIDCLIDWLVVMIVKLVKIDWSSKYASKNSGDMIISRDNSLINFQRLLTVSEDSLCTHAHSLNIRKILFLNISRWRFPRKTQWRFDWFSNSYSPIHFKPE